VKRTITKAIKPKPKRFVPPFKVTGNLLHERNVEQLTAQTNKNQPSSVTNKQPAPTNDPCQGPSGLCNPIIGIHSAEDATTDDDDSDADTETCCMCDRFEPANLDKFPYITLVSWGKCDKCPHWTHLKFCSKVRVIRRETEFLCPHCEPTSVE